MMINNCSASTSNPLPQNDDHRMDPLLFKAAMMGDTKYLQTFQGLSNLQLKRITCDETVLHIAAELNWIAFARASIQICPPLLSLVTSSGDTALHVAAREGHVHMVELFLSHKDLCLTKMVNSEKDTALHCCARSGKTECMKLLVQADPEVCGFRNKAHESPLYLLIASTDEDDVSATIQCVKDYAGSSASHKGPNGLMALHAALLYGDIVFQSLKWEKARTIIEQLVKWRREMIREGDNLGMTPLHYAAFYGNIKAIRLFLEYDSLAIYCLNNDGQSALHIAAFFGATKVLGELVKCRPECYNMVDSKGRTALHAAVLGDQHEVVEFILETPSLARLINKVDNDGNSPMHLAAYFRSYKIIKTLSNKDAGFLLNHNSYNALDVYKKQLKKLMDLQQLEVKDLSKAVVALRYFETNTGVVARHESTSEKLKRMNREVTNSKEEISLRNINQPKQSAKRKREVFGEESALEVNLLVAMLVATVTFAAGFTVPGGLVNDGVDEGLATLTNKPAFKAFVVFNTLAFCCSIYAVLVHFIASLRYPGARVYYKGIATFFTSMAILAMVLAFCFGTYVMLTKSHALSLVPYCISASFLLIYPISRVLNERFKIRKFGESDFDELPPLVQEIYFRFEKDMHKNEANFKAEYLDVLL